MKLHPKTTTESFCFSYRLLDLESNNKKVIESEQCILTWVQAK